MYKRTLLLSGLALIAAGTLSAKTGGDGKTTWNEKFDTEYQAHADFLSETYKEVYGDVSSPVWKDVDSFLYSTVTPEGTKVYEYNARTGAKTESTSEELQKASRRGPGDFDWEEYRRMREKKEFPSPDGKLVALLRDNNIFVRDAGEEGAGRQLTWLGNEDEPYVRLMWSPDSRKIAALRQEKVKERQIILRESRPADQVQPHYNYLDYAKPGDKIGQSTPVLLDVAAGKQIPFSTEAYQNQFSLSLGQWSPNSDYFTFEYNQRGHQLYQLVKVDAATGRNTVLAEEKTNTFVYYNTLWRYYFEDGKRILWISERDDWRHLYMIDAQSGAMRQLTKGEWNVREILNVDEKNGTILMYENGMTATKGEDPYNKHLVRLDLNTLKITDLTPENAFHSVTPNEDFSLFIDNYSRPDLPGTTVLRSAKDGSVISEISKTDISKILAKGYTMPEVFSAKGRDGKTDIWGTIYRPYNYDKKKTYPVVEYIYAGPHDSHVTKNFSARMRFDRLTEMGFVVVTIDGMGTDNRSKSFQDVCWRNLKDAGFPDRILWMKAAARKYKNLDISNVGIYGYSAGGQNTLSALLFYPDFYKVGVALCGCHDNRMDKIWWNEQWMGYPIGPWYGENSNVDNAHLLQGKLLIINGEIDDNVDPASSLQVVYELEKAGKYFEQLHLAGHTHNLGNDWITKRVFEFFWRNIKNN